MQQVAGWANLSPLDFLFLHDRLVPSRDARVSVHDRGFLYGDGLFETLRAAAGRPLFLAEHLARLTASARQFRLDLPPDFPWDNAIRELLAANRLTSGLAAVKIVLTRGEDPALGLPPATRPTVVIFARPYTPPPDDDYRRGWVLATFPERRTTFLGRHKSLNYLFCLAARQYARDRGAQEALLLEGDGSVSEGAATAVLYRQNGAYCFPQAPSALPSVTLEVLERALTRRGYACTPQPTPPDRLLRSAGVWLANSLMGLVPVASLDGRPLALSPETDTLNNLLWSEAG